LEISQSENDTEMTNAGFDFENDLPSSRITKNSDSDECETIDKIAQMVSSITSTTSTPPNTSKNDVMNIQNTSDEMIEDQLKQMFADTTTVAQILEPTNEPSTSAIITISDSDPQKIKKATKPRKKRENGAPGRKKQPTAGVQSKTKNGKPGRKPSTGPDSKPETKAKSKENGGKSKVKPDVAPFVQIQKDGSFAIVNQTVNGDDDAEKAVNKTKKAPNSDRHKVIRGLHMSTLSNKYDAEQRDLTWICAFCKLGPHKNKLGDLFGPYIISKTSEDYSHCLQDPVDDVFRQSNKNKFVKTPPASAEKPKKKRKSNAAVAVPVVNGTMTEEEIFSGMSKVDDNNFEVWMHEECIVWATGVYMIGSKIIGMEAAIWSSTRYRCAYCNLNGAMLSCLSRECRKPSHFGCARKGWKLDDDFKTFCEIHQ
jgi:PHD-like zinc-binding domain